MPTYGNQEGSSVRTYIVTKDGIDITFKNGQTYSYNRAHNDDSTIEIMIELAENGSGLNSFIRKEKPIFN